MDLWICVPRMDGYTDRHTDTLEYSRRAHKMGHSLSDSRGSQSGERGPESFSNVRSSLPFLTLSCFSFKNEFYSWGWREMESRVVFEKV